MHPKYEVVIGLEVHAQLLTNSKIFNGDSTEFGQLPNSNVSVHTLAHPGTLPMLNENVVNFAIRLGLACGCQIAPVQYFDRKNYFYPDLPKGYQTTQDKTPICRGGVIQIKSKDGDLKRINLTKIHMEEDAGKSMHLDFETDSLVDLNRAGVPLLEIVTEPELRNADDAALFVTEVRKLVRYLDICDGNMEEGSMRCDVNISLRPFGQEEFGKKVEVKNLNSFRFIHRAIEFEVQRQAALLDAGENIISETRTFDTQDGQTYSLRTKEELNDYRYFPEPDLQPFKVSQAWIDEIKKTLPPLPNELFEKFTNVYGLSEQDTLVLTENKEVALYFEAICAASVPPKAACNWIIGPVKSYLNELTLTMAQFPISAIALAGLIAMVEAKKLSFSTASQKIYPVMLEGKETDALVIAQQLNVLQENNDDFLVPIVEQVIAKYPEKVKEYQSGKKGLLGMFMGEVMKAAKGKADPQKASALVEKMLEG